MTPGEYTELFFLDEATALAAGHRPFAYCSRLRYMTFIQAWHSGNPGALPSGKWSATHRDDCLQRERLDESGHKRLFEASADTLPEGTFIVIPGSADRRVRLLLGDRIAPLVAGRISCTGTEATGGVGFRRHAPVNCSCSDRKV